MSDREKGQRTHRSTKQGDHESGSAHARALLAELPQASGDIRKILSCLQLALREVEADGFEAALVRASDLPVGTIVVRKSIREAGRKNFSIAHEVGHFVLPGHEKVSIACTASEIGDWANASAERALEREADAFAAELLMPASLVQAIIRGVSPSLAVIEKIARAAGASLSAAAWRYCDLAAEKCAVVWSKDGAIQWVKRTASFPFFLAIGKPVEEGSFAAACFNEAKVPRRPREVSAQLWIPSADLGPSAVLLEQSKALPAYRSVISLLSIENIDGAR
jgi:Zn-dependent peptidase ImmA (M78 family)